MPISDLSAHEAWANLARYRMARWHGKSPGSGDDPSEALPRMSTKLFTPCIEGGFELNQDDAIFAIGSCFARSVESALSARGCDVRSLTDCFDDFELIPGSGRPIGFTNKYNPFAILNELSWALDPAAQYPEKGFIKMSEGVWADPHANPTLEYVDLNATRRRRELLRKTFREIVDCRCVVVTLGLIEAWYDLETGLYLNGNPPHRERTERFRFRVLSYEEVSDALDGIHELLSHFGHPRLEVVVTVSPVPLLATFRPQDVVLANTVSKATLRAAVDAWASQHNNVHYFPSFEVVMNSDPAVAWEDDRRHVRWELVSHIMDVFAEHYMAGARSRLKPVSR